MAVQRPSRTLAFMTTTEHLTTGWEPDLDPTDTVVRRYLAAWIAQCRAFSDSIGGSTITTPAWTLTDASHPTGLFNAVTLTAPLDWEDPWRTIADIEQASAGGSGELHLWSAWPTLDLRRRGWELVGHPPLLIRPPAHQTPAPRPTGTVELREVTSPQDLLDWERIVVDDYPFPELQPFRAGTMVGSPLLEDPRFRLHVGHDDDGRPSSASALMVHDGLGMFAFAVTSPSSRRRGHWRAHAIERLHLAPEVWMSGVFSDDSRPLAEACGFVPILRFALWALPRP